MSSMQKYIIVNDDNSFFARDFTGWRWQEDERQAYKFHSRNDAEFGAELLIALGHKVNIKEY